MVNYFFDWMLQVNCIIYLVLMLNDFRYFIIYLLVYLYLYYGGLYQGVVGQGYGGGLLLLLGIGGGGIVGGVGVVGLQFVMVLVFDFQVELLWVGDWKVGLCWKGNRGGKRLMVGIGMGGFFCELRVLMIYGF